VTNERPKPIFPWEENQAKPTRVFIEDLKPPSPDLTPSVGNDEEAQIEEETEDPITPIIPAPVLEPFASYSRTNAWDDVPEIERYVSALVSRRIGKLQVLEHNPGDGQVYSPLADDKTAPRRKPSMKLTDFPTEFERPSLPVTPAPMRRPSFWGEERDAAGDLPAAEGVPKQEDWDPLAKLEELQLKQSEVLEKVPSTENLTRQIPLRELPESAVPLPAGEKVLSPQLTTPPKSESISEAKPVDGLPENGETVLSPSASVLPEKGETVSPPPTTTTKTESYEEPETAAFLPTSEETDVPPTSITGLGSGVKVLDFGKRDLADSAEDEGVFEPTE
jgi:glycogenin glucosyltransferase